MALRPWSSRSTSQPECGPGQSITLMGIFRPSFLPGKNSLFTHWTFIPPDKKMKEGSSFGCGHRYKTKVVVACFYWLFPGPQDKAQNPQRGLKTCTNLRAAGYGDTNLGSPQFLLFSSVATGGKSVSHPDPKSSRKQGAEREFSIRLRSVQCPRRPELKV